MEQRRLELTEAVTQEQWDILGRTAARLGVEGGGFDWRADEAARIDVYMRDTDAPGHWRPRFVSTGGAYGEEARRVAHFEFAGGEPVARIDVDEAPVEPAYTDVEEHVMQEELERWVRNKWHELMESSGLHFDRGHIPQS